MLNLGLKSYKDKNINRACEVKTAKILIFFLLTSCLAVPAAAQRERYTISAVNGEFVVEEAILQREVSFLADSLEGGRALGRRGHFEAGAWISRHFETFGLKPLNGVWAHSFRIGEERGRNLLGLFPGQSDKYVIVLAHYDCIGGLAGRLYPGADSNASGTVAMLTLARMLYRMNYLGKTYTHNVLFAAVDAKERNSAGSEDLMERVREGKLVNPVTGTAITRDKILCVANLDIIGSTLSPLASGRKDYLLAISDGRWNDAIRSLNRKDGLGLDLAFDYYGSRDFTNIFYRRIGDHVPFLKAGIPCILFTSGITMRTNKETDDAASLDYAVLRQRIILAYYWLVRQI